MKKLLFAIIFCAGFAVSAFGQSTPPQTWTELDGSPRVTAPTTIVWPNGSLTVSGKKVTVSGTGGSGCTPPGTASRVLYDDGAGGCTSTSGLTATSSTVTIVSGVTATFSRAGVLYTGTVTTDNASVQTMLLQGDRATFTANDEAYQSFQLSNDAGTQKEVGRFTWAIPTITAGAENGRLDFSVMTSGTLAKELQLSGADLSPSTSDGLALGTTSLQWSDLFLASGGVLNFANGNVVLTHSSGILTMGTGELRITTVGTNAASVPTIGSTSTFTNKTITASSNVLGGVTMTLGSDADGDIYYRASNVLTRLAKGTAGQVLTMNAGATAPEWAAAAGGSGITIGATTVTSGTATRLLYETAGNVVGEISGATSDGTNVTFGSGNLIATSAALTTPAITTSAIVTRDSLGTTNATGVELINNTAAAAGAQQISPDIIQTAQGWKTTATAASQTVNFRQYVLPVQGAANPTANWVLQSQINAGGYSDRLSVTSAGQLLAGIGSASAPVYAFSGSANKNATGIYYPTDFAVGITANGTLVADFNSAQGLREYIGGVGGRNLYTTSAGIIAWSNDSTNPFQTRDTGFARQAAAVIRATNGSTGAGSLVLGTSTVGSIGTSGVGVLAIANGTAPTSSPADEFQLYAADSAAGASNAFIRNELGEVNRISGLGAINTSSFAKTTDTTLANITGLSRNVEAGRTYAFTATMQTTAAATGGVKFAVSGTATATSISYEGVLQDAAVVIAQTRATALDTTVCASTTSTAGTCTIKGVIVVNAAGTLTIQFAQNASDGAASTVLVNQYMQLIPIS